MTEETSYRTWRAVRRLPLSTRPNSLDYGLQVRTVVASKCLFTLSWSWSRSAFLSSLDHQPQVYLPICSITDSKCISKLAQLRSPNLHDHGLQVYLHTHLTTLLECISKFTRSRLQSVSPNTLDYRLQVHAQTGSIMASECISEFTWSSFSGASRITLKHRLQPVQIYSV